MRNTSVLGAVLLAMGISATGCGGEGRGAGSTGSSDRVPGDASAPGPPSGASDAGSATPSSAPAPIPSSAVYAVRVQGRAGVQSGYGPFALPARLHLVPMLDGASSNGPNPRDVGIFTSESPRGGTAGALHLGTSTGLSALVGGDPGAAAVDVAFVTLDDRAGAIDATFDPRVSGTAGGGAGTLNTYAVGSGPSSPMHHVVAGAVTVRISDGGRSVSGTIQLGGSPASGGAPVSQYSATFAGALIVP